MSAHYRHSSGQVTTSKLFDDDVLVVVIDPEDAEQVERLCDLLYGGHAGAVNQRVQHALREFADPKPPRPDEPAGLGAVVEDADGSRWVRSAPRIGDFNWIHEDGQRSRPWRTLTAVRVLSDGVATDLGG